MEPTRDEIRAWLVGVLKRTGETPSALARRAGLATTTLTRFLNDEDAPMLGLRSIAKVAHAAGEAPPLGVPSSAGFPPIESAAAGLPYEVEAKPYLYRRDRAIALDQAIAALIGERSAADPWVLHSRALELAGYLPDDILIQDLNAEPQRGKVVCAQVYQWAHGRAETVFRLYEPPYLIAATNDPVLRKPLLVDNDRVVIKGLVIASLRVEER